MGDSSHVTLVYLVLLSDLLSQLDRVRVTQRSFTKYNSTFYYQAFKNGQSPYVLVEPLPS